MKLGISDIGESKVQEIQRKYEHIDGNFNLHMIGHLQSNKVKYIIDKVALIHSLDRLSLATELNKRAEEKNIFINTLVQVNIAEEESKHGLKIDKVFDFITEVSKLKNVKIMGLMTMAPYFEDPEESRFVFRRLKELSQEIEAKEFSGVKMKYLSMGMTNDFEVAIEEGANMVRVGSGIFGERIY